MIDPSVLHDAKTVLIVAVMSFATLTRSTVGFGEALIAMPLLVAVSVHLTDAATYVAMVALVVSAMILRQDWRSVRFQGMTSLVIASWIGIPVGFYFLSLAPKYLVLFVLAAVILSFCIQRMLRRTHVHLESDRWAWPFGLVAGMLGGAYNTQGPPIVMYGTVRRWTPLQFRATIQAFAICTVPVIVVSHFAAGHVTPHVFTLFLVSLPFLWVAVVSGRWLNQRVSPQRFVHVVHALLIVIACSMIYAGVSELKTHGDPPARRSQQQTDRRVENSIDVAVSANQ